MSYQARFDNSNIWERQPSALPVVQRSNFAQSVGDAFTGLGNALQTGARNRLTNSQADLTDAQAAQQRFETSRGQDQQAGAQMLASLFQNMHENPAIAEGAGALATQYASQYGLDPGQVAGFFQLFAGNSPQPVIPGMSNEQVLSNNRAVRGDAPLNPGQAYDVDRSQANYDQADATNRYGFDQHYREGVDTARIGAGAAVEAARIKADSDEHIAQTTTTQTRPNYTQQDYENAASDAISGVSGNTGTLPPDVLQRVIARTAQYVNQNNAEINAAAAQAARELVQPTTLHQTFLGMSVGDGSPGAPQLRANVGDQPLTSRAPTVRTRINGNAAPAATPSMPSPAAPAAAPQGGVIDLRQSRNPNADYAAIPHGSHYIDPTGTPRTKP